MNKVVQISQNKMSDLIEQKVKEIICEEINISEWSLSDDFILSDYSEADRALLHIAKSFDLDYKALSEIVTLGELIQYIREEQSKPS